MQGKENSTVVIHRMFEVAKQWCEEHPAWQRICDIDDSDHMQLSWDELPEGDRRAWRESHLSEDEAKYLWREFATSVPYRHRFGFVGEDGVFYSHVLDVPRNTNSVMVFETGGKRGIYYRGGMAIRSSRSKAAASV